MFRWRLCLASTVIVAVLPVIPGSADAQPNVACDSAALRTAITNANAAGGGTLSLTPGCTYVLTAADNDGNGLPIVTTPITISGAASITRSSTANFRIFEIDPPGNLTLAGLTVSNGHSAGPPPNGNGGGIWLNGGGALTVTSGTISGNTADNDGGGISNDGGSVTLLNSTLSNNSAAGDGGGLSSGGNATLTSSTVSGNAAGSTGGGISNFGGLNLSSTRLIGNTSSLGGALANIVSGSAKLSGSSVTGNTATGSAVGVGAGILNTNALDLSSSTVTNNQATGAGSTGAGLFNQGATAIAILTSTTVSSNTAASAPGGIDNNLGSVTLTGSPVAGNVPTNCAGSPTPVPGCSG